MRYLFILIAALGVGCTMSQRTQTESAVANAVLSDADEQALGRQIFQQLQVPKAEGPALRFVEDPIVNSYVETLFNRLTARASEDREGTWQVHVIDNENVVNTFSTPGGHVYVHSGLLLTADNEAEVMGVLAHELGHVVAQHSSREMVAAYGLESVNDLALARNPELLEQIATSISINGTLLPHGRAEEAQADEYAVRYSASTNYDPSGIADIMDKLLSNQRSTTRQFTWLTTHPASPERIANVRKLITVQGLLGTEIGADRLAPIKNRLGGGVPVSNR